MSYAPDTLSRGYDWRHDAECRRADRNVDPDLFHPAGTTGPYVGQIKEAKAICRSCPVITECGDWALAHRQESGIWGGMTEQERISHHRRIARHGTPSLGRAALPENPTLTEAYTALTEPAAADGHIAWLGGKWVSVQGVYYSPNRLAWAATRDRAPVGAVVRCCTRAGCVAHIEDRVEREDRKALDQLVSNAAA